MGSPVSGWKHFLARSNDDRVKVFGVAFIVALVSAVVVSSAAVLLKPLQDAHLEAERAARMALMLDTLPGLREVMEEAGVDTLETRIVDLATGSFASDIDVESYDFLAAGSDPDQSIAIPDDADVAGLRRRALYAPVYLLERDDELLLIVLPVSGNGYQSTLRAMVALEPDLRTIAALTITEQGDTPGLGARIEDPDWQDKWVGKQVEDDSGEIVISVVRTQAVGPYEVDAISGATVTSNGVANMIRYWMGDHGFGPFLDQLRQEGP